jgi:hypothetical protein
MISLYKVAKNQNRDKKKDGEGRETLKGGMMRNILT